MPRRYVTTTRERVDRLIGRIDAGIATHHESDDADQPKLSAVNELTEPDRVHIKRYYEPDTSHVGTVTAIRDGVFVISFGGRLNGLLPQALLNGVSGLAVDSRVRVRVIGLNDRGWLQLTRQGVERRTNQSKRSSDGSSK